MYQRIKITFLLLIIFQGLHSAEEFIGNLWDVFPPAHYICGLVSSNPESGFLAINTGLLVLGLFSWFISTRNHKITFTGLIWIWVVIELINGIGHSVWSVMQKSYTPGVLTAPFLLLLSVYLVKELLLRAKTSLL